MARISKILWVAVSVLALAAAAGVAVSRRGSAGRNEVSDGGTVDGQGHRELPEGTVIDGYPVSAASYAKSGKISSLILSEPVSINGDTFPARTEIALDADRKIRGCVFREDTVVQGYLIRGERTVYEGWPSMSTFYPGGRLYNFTMRKDVVIQGVPCSGNPFRSITLHENGKLSSCALSRDASVGSPAGDIAVKAGQMVYLNEQGELQTTGEVPWVLKGLDWSWPVFIRIPGRLLPGELHSAVLKELGPRYP